MLNRLGFRVMAQRRGRAVLNGTGVALGVALVFGALLTSASAGRAVDRTIEDAVGNADVFVRAVGAEGGSQVPASVVDKVRTLPDVEDADGTYGFSVGAGSRANDTPSLLIGVDLRTSGRFFRFPLREGRMFRAGAPEVVLPRAMSQELPFAGFARVGERIRIPTPVGLREVVLVGILEDAGAGRFLAGQVVFTSLGTARSLTGAGDVVNAVSVRLADGVDPDQWIERHREEIPSGMIAEGTDAFLSGLRRGLDAVLAAYTAMGAGVLFLAVFLIYLTLSMAVTERTRLYGTLHAIGATSAQVRRVVLMEAAALGAGATAIGLLLGLGLTAAFLAYLPRAIEGVDAPDLVVPPLAVAAAVVIGVGATVVSSLLPARRAARLDPVVAMRGERRRDSQLSRAWIVGAVALAGGVALSWAGAASWLAIVLLFVGPVLLVPPLLQPLSRLVGRVARVLAPGGGDVAVSHLVKERSRSAYTLALVMVAMAVTLAAVVAQSSFLAALDRQVERQYGADLQLTAASRFSPEATESIADVPGVQAVTPLTVGSTRVVGHDGEAVGLMVIDPSSYFDVEGFELEDTSESAVRAALGRGGAVVMVSRLADEIGLSRGDSVRLQTPRGPRRFTVAATYPSALSNPLAAVVVGRRDGALFGAGAPTDLHVEVEDGVDPDLVLQRMNRTVAYDTYFHVETSADFKRRLHTIIDGAFAGTYTMLALMGVVGLLGLANTVAASMAERTREIGILRAIGLQRGQVRALAVVESATLTTIALVLAVPLGAVTAAPVVGTMADAFQSTVELVLPWVAVPVVALLGVVAAAIAAIAPARRAARLDPVAALRYE